MNTYIAIDLQNSAKFTCSYQQMCFVPNDSSPDFNRVGVEETAWAGIRPDSSTCFIQNLPKLHSGIRKNPGGRLIQEQMIGHVGSSVRRGLKKETRCSY